VCLSFNIKAQTKIGSVKIKGEIIYLDSIIDKKIEKIVLIKPLTDTGYNFFQEMKEIMQIILKLNF